MGLASFLKSRAGALARDLGYEVRKLRPAPPPLPGPVAVPADVVGVHYGCGTKLVPGWLNCDQAPPAAGVPPGVRFLAADLSHGHPFPDASFPLAYAEDFLEHLTQAQSLAFLYEAHRTLRPGGTLRLSFPGLEGVLAKHYTGSTVAAVDQARWEAYDKWDHHHFYSREELRVVAAHVGFGAVEFASFGASRHPALAAMDARSDQTDVNTYAELTR